MARGADTIVALSSGALPSGVAVVRLSGPGARVAAEALCGPVPPPRRAALREFREGALGPLIDRGLVLYFPGPQSFTGEDIVEFQVHGSRAVVTWLLDVLCQSEGVRLAEAGEFARRAFDNGKLDLTEVDALKDLIAAETESQRQMALARQAGNLRHKIAEWRERLIGLLVSIEAELDFSDEDDVGAFDAARAAEQLDGLRAEWRAHLADFDRAQIIREGFRVVLLGPPNSGKSSLLNRLANSDVAIVTAEAGTTRDLKEVSVNLGGQLFVFVDSAGLGNAESEAEREGVRRALGAAETADLCLLLSAPDVRADGELDVSGPVALVRVASKADLGRVDGCDLALSAKTGRGMEQLIELMTKKASEKLEGGGLIASQMRDRTALLAALGVTEGMDFSSGVLELCAEAVRRAIFELDRLIGRVDVEDMLDQLFSGFCIGK